MTRWVRSPSSRCRSRYVVFFYSVLLLLPPGGPVQSQEPAPDYFSALQARSIGPAGMSGRITAIDAAESDPNVLFVGAATGGLWKSENGGMTWEPVFDDQRVLGIGAVAVFQPDPDVVWVGTG
ncbi:MAG: WD40/YVTN/BNR-like repeat-containing protein [Longimicrobiales bacterium]